MSYLKSLLMMGLVVGVSACAICEQRPAAATSDVGQCIENQRQALENGLSSEISKKQLQISSIKGGAIKISLSSDSSFKSGSAEINPAARELLGQIGKEVSKCDRTVVRVIGNTDSVGKPADNQGLSDRRAAAVAELLISKGVPKRSIKKEGRGERDPAASNDTAEGKRQNRRVDIVVSP